MTKLRWNAAVMVLKTANHEDAMRAKNIAGIVYGNASEEVTCISMRAYSSYVPLPSRKTMKATYLTRLVYCGPQGIE